MEGTPEGKITRRHRVDAHEGFERREFPFRLASPRIVVCETASRNALAERDGRDTTTITPIGIKLHRDIKMHRVTIRVS